jgi:predicted dehydrogenase
MSSREGMKASVPEEPTRVYRAAILGLGFIGGADQHSGDALGQQVVNLDGTHWGAYSKNPHLTVVAGSSRDPGRRERFSRRSNARVYSDWRELLSRECPEIVSVATYSPQHAEMTVEAAQAGAKVIWCEKPMASSLDQADRMLDACRRSGALLVINHNRRFHPHFRRLRKLILEGGLGTLRGASLCWGTGRLGNVGTHFFNALQMVLDRTVEAVSATLDLSGRPDCRGLQFQDPGGWGLIRFAGNLTATFEAADYSCAPATLIIHGDQGRVVVAGTRFHVEIRGEPPVTWPDLPQGETSMDRALTEMIHWLNGGEFPEPAISARHTLEIIVACHLSHHQRGAWVDLPLPDESWSKVIKTG